MANSAIQSSFDRRNSEPNTKKVWEQTVTFTIETGGGHVEIPVTIPTNGMLRESVIEVGAAAGITGTVDVDFDDSNGVEFDTNATLAEGSETIVTYTDKAVNGFIIRVDPSAAPTSGDWIITVTCRGN
jgi:hypothetical protein